MCELYYTPPSDKCFNEVKKIAIKLWREIATDEGYLKEKLEDVMDLKNVQDNFMYMIFRFHPLYQMKLSEMISAKTRKAVSDRLIAGGSPPEFNYFMSFSERIVYYSADKD